MNETLLVFIRKPIEGRVKTRLAKGLGNAKALEIYNWLIQVTKKSFENIKATVQIYFDTDEGEMPTCLNSYSSRIQSGNDLGSRIKLAFLDHLSKDGSKKVVLIGSDCPEMTEEIIQRAFKELDKKEVVFGPAFDGGIYLIGLKGYDSELFLNIEWGTDQVFSQLANRAKILSLNYALLEPKSDIDNKEDFLKFKSVFQSSKKAKRYVLEN